MSVWEMVKQAADELGDSFTNKSVKNWILKRHPQTNANTINCQIIVCTVNHDSRIHYPQNKKPRIANGAYDFLYRPSSGLLEMYDPQKHGIWEIYCSDNGKLGVRKTDGSPEEPPGKTEPDEVGTCFAAESHLRDYLAQNLHIVEEGLELYVDDEGKDGVEYSIGVGFIDILAVDQNGKFVIIELKVARGPDYAPAQVLRYKNWVKINLANGKPVRGIIIAQNISDKIRYAIASDPEIHAMEYEISLSLNQVDRVGQGMSL
ncbi:MAG: endonuclease NucS [Phycisphaerae bacterium]|nr:endonuclease NucS [Phycisphaerae bacterium]